MYGLVNRAIEELICERFGEDAWDTVRAHAGLALDTFISMEPYEDDITYRLVAAANEVLGIPAEEILVTFGEYWTLYTAKEGYGELMKMSGSTLPEFLRNLDTMHARVGLLYPKLRPPSFRCTIVSETELLLHYYSHRAGMAPLVRGLLQGLSKMFEVEMDIVHIQQRPESDHDIFQLRYR
jgi:hypothetical protein